MRYRNQVEPKTLDEITREDFEAYEEVRQGGDFNMVMNAREAADCEGIDLDTHFGIIKHYDALVKKYPGVRA